MFLMILFYDIKIDKPSKMARVCVCEFAFVLATYYVLKSLFYSERGYFGEMRTFN